mgnify:FL=1
MDTVESSNQYVSGMAGRSSQRISFIIIDKRPVEEIRKNRTDGENIHRTIKRTADILNRIPHI